MEGHDSGHAPAAAPPLGLDWETYVGDLVRDFSGWTGLADELLRRSAEVADAPADLGSVEKGLRRLAARGQRPGGKYGRLLLRLFGVSAGLERWARWMSQYHSRFTDLPSRLRLEQLRLWDRPPVSESSLAAWIHVGLATVHHRLGDAESCARRLELAAARAPRAGAAAEAEVLLFAAYRATNRGERAAARADFDRVEALLPDIEGADRWCYEARLLGQRAYHLTRPEPGEPADCAAARALFEEIPADSQIPFVDYRRAAGLAWCTWQLGDRAAGIDLARRALDHAGDGGFVRFRVMALKMLSRMLEGDESRRLRARAAALARRLEDEDLARRVG